MEELTRTNLIANNDKLSPTLQCSICLDLVMEPVECNTCSKLFCKECIDNWLKQSNECPNKHVFVKKLILDAWIKPILDKIYINCPYKDCNSLYAYSTWANHLKRCACKTKGFRGTGDTPTGEEMFEWKEIQIFVRDITDRSHAFTLPLSTTVKELKEKLKEKTGFNVEDQRLSCMGKNLDDERMLEFYGIQQNTTIYQMARLHGGK